MKNRERREQNKESLEIYRALKDGTKTFGEVAKERNCTVNQIYIRLQNDYLTNIQKFSLTKLEEQNLSLLRQKPELEMYFYFMNHNVTFQDLSTIFHKTEDDIIFYFDSGIAEELLPNQIQWTFMLNKRRQQRNKLCDQIMLSEQETAEINSIIQAFEQRITTGEVSPIFKQYNQENLINRLNSMPKFIDLLKIIKKYLSSPEITMEELLKEYSMCEGSMRIKFQQEWISHMLKSEIIAKFKIKATIGAYLNILYNKQIEILNQYLSYYAEFLNTPNLTLHDLEKKYHINLKAGYLLDETFDLSVFSKIVEILEPVQQKRLCHNSRMEMYLYYKNNFVLLKDLEVIFHRSPQEIAQYFRETIADEVDYSEIERTEQKRQEKLSQNVHKLFKLSQLAILYRDGTENKEALHHALITLLGKEKTDYISKKMDQLRNVSFEKLIRSMQLIGLYLYQDNYDIKELERLMDIDSKSIYDYLYYPIVNKIVNPEISHYIHQKRSLSAQLQRQLNFDGLERNGKGQFVKKHRPNPTEE